VQPVQADFSGRDAVQVRRLPVAARRLQIASRIGRAVPAEAMPSSDTPRMMKGITVVANS
jgi:hypothetical protein